MRSSDPLVSYVIICYNQEEYIMDALKSAFSQDYNNIEFIISDDNSKDKTSEIIKDYISNCNEIVEFIESSENVGLAGNFSNALSKASGEIIVVAAGDDISLPSRVSNTVKYFRENPNISFLSFNDLIILNSDKTEQQLFNVCEDKTYSYDDYFNSEVSFFSGASRAFKRDVYVKFGNLNFDCPTEDTPYIFRCLSLGDGLVSASPGIYYRKHTNNLSSSHNASKMNISLINKQYKADLKRATELKLLSEKQVDTFLIWGEYHAMKKKLARCESIFKRIVIAINYAIKNSMLRKYILRKIS